MLIMTAKLSKGKCIAAVLAVVVLIAVLWAVVGRNAEPQTEEPAVPNPSGVASNEARLAYIRACGYEIEPEPVQTQEVMIPKEFNEVFQKYQSLQQAQGFDLSAYAGKRAKRYVYRVTEGDNANVTLIIYRDTVIAADVSCAEGERYMKPLVPGSTSAKAA